MTLCAWKSYPENSLQMLSGYWNIPANWGLPFHLGSRAKTLHLPLHVHMCVRAVGRSLDLLPEVKPPTWHLKDEGTGLNSPARWCTSFCLQQPQRATLHGELWGPCLPRDIALVGASMHIALPAPERSALAPRCRANRALGASFSLLVSTLHHARSPAETSAGE